MGFWDEAKSIMKNYVKRDLERQKAEENSNCNTFHFESTPETEAIAALYRSAISSDFDSNKIGISRKIAGIAKETDNKEARAMAIRLMGWIGERVDFDSSRKTISDMIADLF